MHTVIRVRVKGYLLTEEAHTANDFIHILGRHGRPQVQVLNFEAFVHLKAAPAREIRGEV